MTPEQQHLLEKPFTFEEHGFVNNNPYILKSPIRRRLSQVDPHWSITPPEVVTVHGDLVVMSAVLTVAGSSRGALGTGLIQHATPDANGVLNPTVEAKLLATAYKTANRDCLPRCAEEFNVGWYLKGLTRQQKSLISSEEGLKKHLASVLKEWAAVTHWAHNGAGKRFNARMQELGLQPAYVLAHLEDGRTLTRLSDTMLSEAEAFERLEQMTEGV